MKFTIDESLVEATVNQINLANPAYQFDWRTYLVGTVQEGRYPQTIIFLENQDAYALIYVGSFDVSNVQKLTFLDKSQIQGLKVKKGLLTLIVKIRMKHGEFIKMRFGLRGAGKSCPLHKENLARYQYSLVTEFADRQDLRSRASIGWKFVHLLAWLIVIPLAIIVGVVTQSKGLGIGTFVVGFLGYSWLVQQGEQFLAKRKDKAFFDELKIIEMTYTETEKEAVYQALVHMTHQPRTELFQVTYYGMLIVQAHDLGRDEEAKNYLELFPRHYSEGAEETYQGLVNYLAIPVEEMATSEKLQNEPQEENNGTDLFHD